MARELLIPVSVGELVDKMTILEIKVQACQGLALEHVSLELQLLTAIYQVHCGGLDAAVMDRLRQVNRQLWSVEDELRDCEARHDFGHRFVHLARSVYRTNDKRAHFKRQLNLACGSAIVEEKSYRSSYGASPDHSSEPWTDWPGECPA